MLGLEVGCRARKWPRASPTLVHHNVHVGFLMCEVHMDIKTVNRLSGGSRI